MKEISGVSLEVYDPSGAIETTEVYAPRLASLNGKTICLLSNFRWESDRTFSVIQELLQRRFPDVNVIPYTEFPRIYGVEADVLSKWLREKGCDGAVVGNAA